MFFCWLVTLFIIEKLIQKNSLMRPFFDESFLRQVGQLKVSLCFAPRIKTDAHGSHSICPHVDDIMPVFPAVRLCFVSENDHSKLMIGGSSARLGNSNLDKLGNSARQLSTWVQSYIFQRHHFPCQCPRCFQLAV